MNKTRQKKGLLWAPVLGIALSVAMVGCMDNTEPEGIVALRGAQADLISAQAAWETANAEYRSYEALSEKYLAMQDSLDYVKKEALLDETIAYKQLELEQDMLDLEAEMLDSQETYEKALVDLKISLASYADDTLNAKVNGYQSTISGLDLPGKLTALLNAKKSLLAYDTEQETYEAGLEKSVEAAQSLYDIQVALLAEMESLKDSENYQEEITKVEADLNELATTVGAMIAALPTSDDDAIQSQIDQTTAAAALNITYTISKDDYTEAMQKESTLVPVTSLDSDDKMVVDYTIKAPIASLYTQIGSYAEAFENILEGIYNATFSGSIADLTEAEVTRLQNELTRLNLDLAILKAAMDEDITEWVKAHTAYTTAVNAYEAYEQTAQSYTDLVEEVEAYTKLDAADQTVAAANALMAKVAAYGAVRDAVDDSMPTYAAASDAKFYSLKVVETVADAETEIALTDFDSTAAAPSAVIYPATGTWSQSYAANNEGAVSAFIESCSELFGCSLNNINEALAYEPTAAGAVPAGIDYTSVGGTYNAYYTASNNVTIISEIDTWVAMIAQIEGDADGYEADYIAYNAEIADLNAQLLAVNQALYDAEYAIALLDNDAYTWTFTTCGYTKPTTSEQDVLSKYLSDLETAATNNTFYVTTYDATSGYDTVTGQTIYQYITAQESTVAAALTALTTAQTNLAYYTDLGFNSVSYRDTLVAAETSAQTVYDDTATYIAQLNAIISNLIAAFAE